VAPPTPVVPPLPAAGTVTPNTTVPPPDQSTSTTIQVPGS
jgi:hypothetical protein